MNRVASVSRAQFSRQNVSISRSETFSKGQNTIADIMFYAIYLGASTDH